MNNILKLRCIVILSISLFSLSILGAEKPQEIDSFIQKNAVVSRGVMNSIHQNGHYYLEIPNRIIGRDMLVAISITRGAQRKNRPEDMRFGYGGDSMFSKLIRFSKSDNTVDILLPETYYFDVNNQNNKYLSSVPNPIYKSFDIIAQSSDSYLIDITEMLMSDDQLFSLKGGANDLKIAESIDIYTKIESIHSFPENINFLSLRSYNLASPEKSERNNSQWEVSSSWYLLPEKPMTPRINDDRVGYFTYGMRGLATRNDNLELGQLAAHWRLEPKDEDMDKYLRGELVEPKKPIVYYISQSVPDYLRPYFIKAVNNWNVAFEAAGFKNAIHGEMTPSDSTYDEGDIRYPLISYKASPIPNAYGPHVVDPRSGEIITSHIAIYHSVLDLIQRWYFVMCAPVDKRAISYPLSKDIVAKLAETVLTHEVGHTLGLRHNFYASSIYPVDSLRSGKFIHENGLGGSIMDYQRFNYVAQPGDDVQPEDLLPRVGTYDKFAIEWGYRYRKGETLAETTKALRKWVTEKRATDIRCMFLLESELGDPRVQSEDSGDDDIKANTYGMSNLKYIMNNLEAWTQTPDNDYYPLRRRYLSVLNQYWNYIGHVVKYINGHFCDRPDRDEKLNIKTIVPKEQQLRALNFIKDYLLTEPTWLWRHDLMEKTNVDWSYALNRGTRNLAIILLKYSESSSSNADKNFLSDNELFSFLYDNLYGKYPIDAKLSVYVRMLQKNFLTEVMLSAENQSTFGIGVGLKLKQMLEKIKAHAQSATLECKDDITRSHHESIANFITMWQTGDNKSLQ